MTHAVEDIAAWFKTSLADGTTATVSRDRNPSRPIQLAELPLLDVRIGPDDPIDDQVQGFWRSEQTFYVDGYVSYRDDEVSTRLNALRAEADAVLMASAPRIPGVASAIRILRGGSEDVNRIDGEVPLATQRWVYFVLYQHSLTDPEQ